MSQKKKSHPGTIERRGESLRLILYVGGTRHTFTIAHTDRRAAEKFAREKERELTKRLQRSRAGFATSTRFSALLDQYRRDELPTRSAGTQRAYEDSLKMIREYFFESLALRCTYGLGDSGPYSFGAVLGRFLGEGRVPMMAFR